MDALIAGQLRFDQKCGNSGIAPGKKCKKGTASSSAPAQKKKKWGPVKKGVHLAVGAVNAARTKRNSMKRAQGGDHFSEIFGSF